eukprot:1190173-Rhodomonas_salina.6
MTYARVGRYPLLQALPLLLRLCQPLSRLLQLRAIRHVSTAQRTPSVPLVMSVPLAMSVPHSALQAYH